MTEHGESLRPVFAANWKMHKGPEETREFVRRFRSLHEPLPSARVVFFPPAVSLEAFRDAATGRPDLELGVQDVHPEREGAHTGAVGVPMAAAAGATWGLAGHSERRREFGEPDALVAAKLRRLVTEGLQAVLCVGETLEEREEGRLEAVLARQLRSALDPVAAAERREVAFAYEPVWAIGTGRTASPRDAAEAHALLRDLVADLIGSAAATSSILYGGSVKPDNVAELLAAEGVDGVLVGGASLDPGSWAAICRAGRAGGAAPDVAAPGPGA